MTADDQRFHRGERVRGLLSGLVGTVAGPAPRGPHREPSVIVEWDGGTGGGPAYEHHLTAAEESGR